MGPKLLWVALHSAYIVARTVGRTVRRHVLVFSEHGDCWLRRWWLAAFAGRAFAAFCFHRDETRHTGCRSDHPHSASCASAVPSKPVRRRRRRVPEPVIRSLVPRQAFSIGGSVVASLARTSRGCLSRAGTARLDVEFGAEPSTAGIGPTSQRARSCLSACYPWSNDLAERMVCWTRSMDGET